MESAGQIIVFSNNPVHLDQEPNINQRKFLALLNQSYQLDSCKIFLNFKLEKTASSTEAFIIPNKGEGISIIKSTCGLDDVQINKGSLQFHSSSAGEQEILWPVRLGEPKMMGSDILHYFVKNVKDFKRITIQLKSEGLVVIKGSEVLEKD